MKTKRRTPGDGANFRMLNARLSRVAMEFPQGKIPVEMFGYFISSGRTVYVYVPGCDMN